MGGKIKTPRQPRRALFRPVAAGWQKWDQGEGGAWTLAGEAAEMAGLSPAPGGLIAVPVRRAFSLAVWVPADDPFVPEDVRQHVISGGEVRAHNFSPSGEHIRSGGLGAPPLVGNE